MTGVSTLLPALLRDDASASGLIRAADSVLGQNAAVAHELLIIDDGSTPPLAERGDLKPLLQRSGVRLLRLEGNHGLAYALNAGLTQAHYEWIARIDDDDLWREDKLRRQMEALERDPDLTLIATGMRVTHGHHAERDRDEARGGGWAETLALCARIGCPFPHGSILARRDVFETLGGYPQSAALRHCEDFALWARWIRFFKVTILDEILFEYSISEKQVSSRFAMQQETATAEVWQRFRGLADMQRLPEAIAEVARRAGRPLLETSKILATAWMFCGDIVAGPHYYALARTIFPDRSVHPMADAADLCADTVFVLDAPGVTCPAARVALTMESLSGHLT